MTETNVNTFVSFVLNHKYFFEEENEYHTQLYSRKMSIQFFYICIREKRAYDFNELIVKYRIINYQTINLIGKLILSGDEVKYNIN